MTATTEQEWTVDGQSLNNYAICLKTITGREGITGRRGENRQVAYRPGRIRTQKFPEQRSLSLVMWAADSDADGVIPSNAAARLAQFNDNIESLKAIFARRTRELALVKKIRTGAGLLTLSGKGECAGAWEPQYSDPDLGFADIAAELVMADPYWYGPDTSASVLVGAGGVVAHPGTVERVTKMTIRFVGPLTNPILTNTTADPDIWVKLGATIGAGQWIELDVLEGTALSDAGANMIGTVSHSGAHQWLELLRGNNALTIVPDSGTGHAVITFGAPYE